MHKRILVATIASFLAAAGSAHAVLINGDFETGDLTGWTTFTTPNGTLGGPGDVVPFDTDGDGTATKSARFRVGQAVVPGTPGGGGIYQDVTLGAGTLVISAEIASFAPSGNFAAGFFELLFDGTVVDSHDFGSILGLEVKRASLSASFPVTAGLHEVRLRMIRPFGQNPSTPLQFVDDVDLSGTAVEAIPEPGSITLLGLGLLGLAGARRRPRC